eukprot:3084470-Amphidinium_carterae.1
MSRTIAQRTKLRTTADGSEQINLRRRQAHWADTSIQRETQQRYQGLVFELKKQVEDHKIHFRERLRETVEREVKDKSEEIAEVQGRMGPGHPTT